MGSGAGGIWGVVVPLYAIEDAIDDIGDSLVDIDDHVEAADNEGWSDREEDDNNSVFSCKDVVSFSSFLLELFVEE